MAQISCDAPDASAGDESRPLTLAEALPRLLARLSPATGVESAALPAAAGRILAQEVTAAFNLPPHDNSAVDGYAVFHADLSPDAETVLPVTGRIAAGQPPGRAGQRGEAMRIFTGAPMPAGFDTVVMQEDCGVLDGGAVRIRPGSRPGDNRRRAGEDVQAGSTVLTPGRRLRPADIGLAASLGYGALAVRTRLRVAVFSTGDELRDPLIAGSAPLPAAAIFDANRFSLQAILTRMGCQVTDLGILPDDPAAIAAALAAAAAAHDLLLTSGGVSLGEEDHVKAVVARLGALHLWRLAIKPGRPVAVGRIGETPFLGLPGNPVAVLVTFMRVARPLVLRLMGAAPTPLRFFPLPAAFTLRRKTGRREFLRAILEQTADGGLQVNRYPRDGSGVLSSLVESDGLIELPEDCADVHPGDPVAFIPFSELE